jgi:hypothetical protein
MSLPFSDNSRLLIKLGSQGGFGTEGVIAAKGEGDKGCKALNQVCSTVGQPLADQTPLFKATAVAAGDPNWDWGTAFSTGHFYMGRLTGVLEIHGLCLAWNNGLTRWEIKDATYLTYGTPFGCNNYPCYDPPGYLHQIMTIAHCTAANQTKNSVPINEWSAISNFYLPVSITVMPPSPSTLSYSNVTSNSFNASWLTVAGATSYRLDVSTSPTFNSYTEYTTNTTSQVVNNLSPLTTYYARVSSINAGGSNFSNNITFTTLLPAPPTMGTISASNITHYSFYLNWNAVPEAVSYRVDVSQSPAFNSYIIQNQTTNVNELTVSDLSALTTYYARVRGVNLGGTGIFSNTLTINTITSPNLSSFYYADNSASTSSSSNILAPIINSQLTGVVIGLNATSIAENAFNNKSSILSLTIGNNVKTIGAFAFQNCSGLTNVNIPNSVTGIGQDAFKGCTNLDTVILGNGIKSIPYGCFDNCKKLTNINIPNTVTSIGDISFAQCEKLTGITIPNSVTTLGQQAFDRCGIKNIVIPDSVTSVGTLAFYYCTGLQNAVIGNNLQTLGDGMFNGCINLKNITIGDNVQNLGGGTFVQCNNLTQIVIPKKVQTIGSNAFGNCDNLRKVYFLGNLPAAINSIFGNNTNINVYRYSNKTGWDSTFQGKTALLIDSNQKKLQTFSFQNITPRKFSFTKQNLGGGRIISNKNYILNSQFDADNQYPISDGSLFFDNNFGLDGLCYGVSSNCGILTNYQHNSPLLYEELAYRHTFANRTFHEINSPYDILPIGHPIQPRLLKMFGAGSLFGKTGFDYYRGDFFYLKTITNTTSFSPNFNQSWAKYGVEQSVIIPSWATKVVYGVKYLAKSDDLFRDNNFAGLKLNFRLPFIGISHRNYVNVHLIRRSTASAVDTLESLYGSNVYTYFDADREANAMSQWLGPNVSRVKVRKRSSTIIDSNTNQFIKIKDTIDIPTFSSSSAEPDFGNGRPYTVSLEMFFAEWLTNLDDNPNISTGSIYFYEPFISFL